MDRQLQIYFPSVLNAGSAKRLGDAALFRTLSRPSTRRTERQAGGCRIQRLPLAFRNRKLVLSAYCAGHCLITAKSEKLSAGTETRRRQAIFGSAKPKKYMFFERQRSVESVRRDRGSSGDFERGRCALHILPTLHLGNLQPGALLCAQPSNPGGVHAGRRSWRIESA